MGSIERHKEQRVPCRIEDPQPGRRLNIGKQRFFVEAVAPTAYARGSWTGNRFSHDRLSITISLP
jgi:hypothetical protein